MATASTARIVEETSPGAITENAFAREQRHAVGEPGLVVELIAGAPEHATARAELEAALAKCASVRLSTDGSAFYRLYALGPRPAPASTDAVPQLGALSEPVWALIDRDGELALPALSLGNPRTVGALTEALVQLARRRALLLFENPSPSSNLRGSVTLEVLARQGAQWLPVAPDTSGQIVLSEETRIAIRIKSSRMLLAYGFLRKVFEIFEKYRTSIDMITTSEVAVSVTIDNDVNLSHIIKELEPFGTIETDSNQTLVSVVGNEIEETRDVMKKLFDSIEPIPVRMVSYGGSKHNVTLLIDRQHKEQTLQLLNKGL